MIAYKYLTPDRIDVLEHSRIRFTQPSVFNDPFDTSPNQAAFLVGERIKLNRELAHQFASVGGPPELADVAAEDGINRRLKSQQDFIDENYLCLSLSRKRDNLLMWSHYAHSHQGFVTGFDTDSSFFATQDGKELSLGDVEYSRTRPELPPGGLTSLSEEERKQRIKNILFTKGPGWKYEKEVRIFAAPELADALNEDEEWPSDKGHKIFLFTFPKECVREIIVGAKTELDPKKKIAQYLKMYPNAKIFEAEPHDMNFALCISPIIKNELIFGTQSERRHKSS